MFLNHPINGIGPNLFRFICHKEKYHTGIREIDGLDTPDKACSTHPHNTYMQILSETGIIGFLLLLFGLCYILLNICKNHHYEPLFQELRKKKYHDQ